MIQMKPYPTYKPSNIEWLGDVPGHWKVRRLKRICRFAYGDTLTSGMRQDGSIPVLGSNGQVGVHSVANTHSPCVVVGRKGSFGKINYIDQPAFAIDTTYFVDDRHSQNDLKWLFYLLGYIRLDDVTRDSAIPGLNREDAYERLLPHPPFQEQRAIARYLDYMDSRIQRYIRAKERLIELLEEQKRAVINQAVTRGLDPDVPMKPSGVEWLGDVPAHWEVRRLKHWVGINDEALNESTNPDYRFKYIDIGSVDKGRLIKPPETMVFSAAPSRARRVISHGDTIISTVRTYLKAIWYVEHEENVELVCSTGFAVLRPLGGTFPKFVSYLVQSDSFADRVTASSVGVAYPAIPESRLASFHVAIPPHSEQMSIAGRLDSLIEKFDNQQTSAERQIELIKEYRTRLIADVVTGKLDVREAAAGLPEDEGDVDVGV